MMRLMMVAAEPADLQRLAVVVMVHLRVRRSADFARPTNELATPQIDTGIAARDVLASLFRRQRMKMLPETPPFRMAFEAITVIARGIRSLPLMLRAAILACCHVT